jgi:hypothetical protein
MSAADSLRLDLTVNLRLAIDASAQIISDGDGTSADLARLIGATEALVKMLPNRELPQPVPDRDDPRRLLFEMYMEMRERGEISDEGKVVDALRDEVERLTAELAALKAGKTEHSDIPTMVERVPAAGGNVVPMPRPNPPAAPQYNYDTERGWRDHVLPDGSIV